MKRQIIMILFLALLQNQDSYAQLEVRDSIFVEINKLDPSKLYYGLSDYKINYIGISVKNKYGDLFGFMAGYSNSNFYLKNRKNIPLEKVISYEKFNELLNDDFLKIHYYYKICFIISEDRDNYLVLDVRPITPPYFNRE